jgi:hypothetical protein
MVASLAWIARNQRIGFARASSFCISQAVETVESVFPFADITILSRMTTTYRSSPFASSLKYAPSVAVAVADMTERSRSIRYCGYTKKHGSPRHFCGMKFMHGNAGGDFLFQNEGQCVCPGGRQRPDDKVAGFSVVTAGVFV